MRINNRQNIKNLRAFKWEQWQVDYLVDNYNYKSNVEIGYFIEKSRFAVGAKLYTLGLVRDNDEYISLARARRKADIALENFYKELEILFRPPPKEPCNNFTIQLYRRIMHERKRNFNHRRNRQPW